MSKANLRVRDLPREEFYKGMARVWWEDRGKDIPLGSIVRVRVLDGPVHFFAVFGTDEKHKGTIALDHYSREVIKVRLDQSYEFTIEEASISERLVWAAKSPDPTARIAAWIGIVSGIIGILGLVLAVLGLYPIAKELKADFWFTLLMLIGVAMVGFLIGVFWGGYRVRAPSR